MNEQSGTDSSALHYGSWPSPVMAEAITAGTVGLSGVTVDGQDVYWVESRPQEEGRSVLVRLLEGGRTEDVTPPPFNVRTRVHEYGGRCHTVLDGTVYFSHFLDDRLYRQSSGEVPVSITPALNVRYADPDADTARGRLILVREDHRTEGQEARNELVAITVEGRNDEGGRVLATGADFYAAPRLSPDGRQLAWTEWDHPNMPWDTTRLMLADVDDDGGLLNARVVAGGVQESVVEPRWSPDGLLHFVSDRSGWWNLCRLNGETEAIWPMEAEFSVPQWEFGASRYAFLEGGEIVCAYDRAGETHLAVLKRGPASWTLTPLDVPFRFVADLQSRGSEVLIIGGAPDRQLCVARVSSRGAVEVVSESGTWTLEAASVSLPEALEFPTGDGLSAFAFLYRPRLAGVRGPDAQLPPLLLLSHGGPTSAAQAVLHPEIQFWTTRGFAVLDVNYGGSSGFGRVFRQRLEGQWGLVDVQDCVNAARFVAARGDVDAARMAITGGSAGGYTTLCALTFHDTFAAGTSHYGVSDVEALAKDTHKFESRYLDGLIGPYPQDQAVYQARSPVHFAERLTRPVAFFQGLEDRVVPPDQARTMYEAVKARGLPTVLVEFEGEGHGFRRAENIRRALEGELLFYGHVFGFTPANVTTTLDIQNSAR
ncbi:prolyl oligopeptidase family serine peptidase [Deinococcus radiomollis]|uniref:S9 family peptidase n=1 Tax=Deinococcus radiomollis TaxID=468916 RepID=UPI00389154A1